MTVDPVVPALIDWPRDEAAHVGLPWEIWWITASVTAGDRRLSCHLLFVHLESGHLVVTTGVSDLQTEVETSAMRVVEPGQATVSAETLNLSTEIASCSGTFESGYRIRGLVEENSRFELELSANRPILYAAGAGQFAVGNAKTSQYSIGGLSASGQVNLDGQQLTVAGTAWYDRQWLDAGPAADLGAFTWFGMCLDNGDTISLWDTTVSHPNGPSWATIVRADGTHIVTSAQPAAGGSSGSFTTPHGRLVPRAWKLHLAAVGADLEVHQRLVHDETATFFYTGSLEITGTYEGSPVTGYGYCDLVGWPDRGK